MVNYETIHIRTDVYKRLSQEKELLQNTYKKEITWSKFFYLLVAKGQTKAISISDIQDQTEAVIGEIQFWLGPKGLR